MKDENGLLPCPFCGGKAKVISGTDHVTTYWYVLCLHCTTSQTSSKDYDKVIKKWNTRHSLSDDEIREGAKKISKNFAIQEVWINGAIWYKNKINNA